MSGVILNIINFAIKLINMVIKITVFLIEKIGFRFAEGIGLLLESFIKSGTDLVRGHLVR